MNGAPAGRERPPAIISVGALRLVRWRWADLQQLHEAVASSIEHLRPWMTWATHVDLDARARFLNESEEGWERAERFEYSMRDPAGAVLGSIGMMRRIAPGGLEIGYWVHAAHTRKGLATLAAAATTESALALVGVDHVEIRHDRANVASGRVPARLGFRRLGAYPREPAAPSESGVDVRWQMTEPSFPGSPAAALLQSARPDGRGRRAAGSSRA